MVVLDTDTVIDYFKGKGKVAERLLAVPPGKLRYPRCRLRSVGRRPGLSECEASTVLYEQFLSAIEVIPFDSAASRRAAELRHTLERRGASIGPLDTLIAGTALACGAALVTRNVKEFGVAGLEVVNWHD